MRYKFVVLVLSGLVSSCAQIKKDHDHEDLNIFKYHESAGISILDPANVTRFEDFLTTTSLLIDSSDEDLAGGLGSVVTISMPKRNWRVTWNV